MMILDDFRLHRPTTVAGAIELRAALGDDAALYAGGTELLLALKIGVLSYEHLIDLKRCDGLRGIERAGDELRIGALTTHRELELSPLVKAELPSLAALERHVANVRVRAAGTIGGNLAFAEPHADPGTLLAALGATVELTGPEGVRESTIDDFLLGAYEADLQEGEIMSAIRVPLPLPGARAAYRKYQVLERPMVGVAVVAAVDDGAFAADPVVVVGAVDERPMRVPVEGLAGVACDDEEALASLAAAAQEVIDPVEDLSGSEEYKRHVTGVMVRRALAAATSEEEAAA
jgi:carbon-monoxide dehydrogenase medium subunit